MDPVTDSAMAVSNTFNSIVNEIQMSKLNFAIQLTPFAAYITLKKTTQIDMDGVPCQPAPPVFSLLLQSHKDLNNAQEEIAKLKVALAERDRNPLQDLVAVNASLHRKLKSADDNISVAHAANNNLLTKLDEKEKENTNLLIIRDNLERDLKHEKKQYYQDISEADAKFKGFNKTIKSKDKEVHNLSKNLDNARGSNSNSIPSPIPLDPRLLN